MQLNVVVEQRFAVTPDRVVWTSGGCSYSSWERYLDVFDNVQVVARVLPVNRAQEDWKRVEGPRVSVAALPYYLGPFGYMLKRLAIRRKLRNVIGSGNAVILRVPSPIGSLATDFLDGRVQPYGAEVVGDPYDVFAPGAVRHPLRPLMRWWFPRRLRKLCRNAAAAAYVTESTLQKRYLPSPSAFATGCSDIELPPAAFVDNVRAYEGEPPRRIRLISVGSLGQMYKAPDIVIEAVKRCIENHIDVELVWAGDGKHRSEMEDLARNTGYPDRFHFVGNLPGAVAVREELDRADIFILASRTEGLPRAVVEAMARGLPCIGSTAGGIPELLPAECLVPPNDVGALAAKIVDYCRNPKWMEAMSQRNLRKAQEYRDEVLSKRRTKFYQHVRETTERYLKKAG